MENKNNGTDTPKKDFKYYWNEIIKALIITK